MTVARLFPPEPGRLDWEVVFLESARYYRVGGDPELMARSVEELKRAVAAGERVTVRLASIAADLVEEVWPA